MKTSGRILIACLLPLTLLAACTVGPDYVRPTAPIPDAYKELDTWRVAEPKDNVTRGSWWEIFDNPELNTLEEKVNISNQNIAMAEAQYRQSRALVRAARAAFFPTATAGASFTRSRTPVSAGATLRTTGTTSEYVLTGDASWEPDIWGKVRRTVEASRASAQASAADLESVRLIAHATVAQDYFQLRTLDAEKQLLDATVIDYQKSLQLTKNRYASGVASKEDILLAETLLKTTQAQAIDIGVQRSQLEHAIAVLIGEPASVFSISPTQLTPECLFNLLCIQGDHKIVPPAVPVGVPSELLERRPDIAAAERLVAAANAQIGIAEAAYYPNLMLTASGGFQGSQLSNWISWPNRFWAVGASILETIFDAGLRRAQTEQARAAYEATVASYRQTVLTGFQEVEDNLAALRILEEEARVQDEAVRAAQQSVKVLTNQYRAGTASYLDVIVVQTAALNNERTAMTILGQRMNAAVLLIKAIGGGWDASALPSAEDLLINDEKRGQTDLH